MSFQDFVGEPIYWSVVAIAISGAITWVLSCVDVTVTNIMYLLRKSRDVQDDVSAKP